MYRKKSYTKFQKLQARRPQTRDIPTTPIGYRARMQRTLDDDLAVTLRYLGVTLRYQVDM